MDVKKISYGGWENCYQVSNGKIDAVITADVGPRVIRFGFTGRQNEFVELEDQMGTTGGDEWQAFGGHRFWHAPEMNPRTYFGDNHPVKIETDGGDLTAIQDTETTTRIQKTIHVHICQQHNRLTITHTLTNHNLWAVELAPWALSVMATGGKAIMPIPPKAPHSMDTLLPVSSMALWSYTDFSDPRWTWGSRYTLLQQDVNNPVAQKIGYYNPEGWMGYVNKGHLFVKTFDVLNRDGYTDFNSNAEFFTNDAILEMETVGQLAKINPGESVDYVERWYLFEDVSTPTNDDDVNDFVLPKIKELQSWRHHH